MAVLISPVFNIPFFTDVNGNPLNGGKIFQYEAGSSSVLKQTFSTFEGDVGNENPIVLNSAGQLPAGIALWLTSGEAYNLVLTEADGTTVLKGFDVVYGVGLPGGGGGGDSSIWVFAPDGTYLSPTSFLVSGNLTQEFAVGNRVRLTQSGGYTYGVVSAVSFSTPNTTVTIIPDAGSLDSSLSEAYYSILIASGRTVDAGGVSYFSALSYATPNTVGAKLKALDNDIINTNIRIDPLRRVWPTSGAYTITPSPAITTYSVDQVFTVLFSDAGGSSLNVNGVGSVALKVYDASGAKVDPAIVANTVSDVAYDGTNFIVLDFLPPASASAPVHGRQVFTSNGTFTVPASVYSLKVTCVGGGAGGGGAGYFSGESGDRYWPGGGGGGGGVASSYVTTTPSTNFGVSIGSGGGGGAGGSGYVGSNGVAGGTTSFGITVCSASGGAPGTGGQSFGGSSGSAGTGGAGGSSGNDFIIPGGRGGNGDGSYTSIPGLGGSAPGYSGGGSIYGGGGAGSALSNGSAGSPGICVVEW